MSNHLQTTDVCLKIECEREPLTRVNQGRWFCPKCHASYGYEAKANPQDFVRKGDKVERLAQEAVDRTRRIETRLTRYLESLGFDTQVKRPTWNDGVITLQSMDAGIKELLALVPPDWNRDTQVSVMHGGHEVMEFFIGEAT